MTSATTTSQSPAGPPGRLRLPGGLAGLLWWIVLPTVCLVVVISSVFTVLHHRHDALIGLPGTFTVTSDKCVDRVCSTIGDYFSDDGTVVKTDILGDQRWHSGTHRAYYDGGAPDALAAQHTWDSTSALLSGGASLVYLVTIGWLGFAESRRASD